MAANTRQSGWWSHRSPRLVRRGLAVDLAGGAGRYRGSWEGGTSEFDVIVVGAGAAGLAAASYLRYAGFEVVVVEADSVIGGRLRTDTVDGCRLDRGFHVVLEGYAELRRLLVPGTTGLAGLFPGVGLLAPGEPVRLLTDPRRVPATLAATLAEVARLLGVPRARRLVELIARADPSVADLVAVLPEDLGRRLVGPFARGVLLAPELDVPLWRAREVLGGFRRGRVGLPQGGIATLASILARDLEGAIRTTTPVASVETGGVVLESGERLEAPEVIVATGPEASASLLGAAMLADGVRWRAQGYAHLRLAEPVLEVPVVALGPLDEPIWTVCEVGTVDPLRAPMDRDDTMVTLSFDPTLEPEEVLGAAARLVPALGSAEVLAIDVVARALPEVRRRPAVRFARGITLAGDWTASPSLDGALGSGRRAAEFAAQALGGTGGEAR